MSRHRLILLIPFALVLILIISRFVASAFAQPAAAASLAASPSPTATGNVAYPGPAAPWPTALLVSYPVPSGHVHVVRQSDVLPSPTAAPTRTPIPTRVTPPIQRIEPKAHGFISPFDPITISFNREVDKASVEAAFALTPAVTGTFEWQGSQLIFHPVAGLFAEDAAYTLTLATTARTAAGEALLTEPLNSMFHTTALKSDAAWFGGGADVQVMPAEGRRVVQFMLANDSPRAVSFELYALAVEQFLTRYERLTDETDYYLRRAIRTDGAPLVARWPLANDAGVKVDAYDSETWLHETIIPAEVTPGLYVLNLNVGRLNDQLLVVVSRNALTLRQADHQLTAWLANASGAVSNAEVVVYGSGGQLMAQAVTNGAGLAQFDVSASPLLAVARQGDDVTVAGFGAAWRTPVGYRSYGQPEYAGHLFTDRRLYTPGDDVNFKAVLRRDRDGALEMLPKATPVTAKLLQWMPEEWNWKELHSQTLATNAFGSVDGRFALAQNAPPGAYTLSVLLGGQSFEQTFIVQAPVTAHSLRVMPESPHYVAGETVRVIVEVRDASGNPAPEISVTVKRHFISQGYVGGNRYENIWVTSDRATTVRTDATGRATLEFVAELPESYGWHQAEAWREGVLGLEAAVGNAGGFRTIRVASAAERITLSAGGGLYAAGQPVAVSAQVATLAGQPVSARTLAVELLRYNANDYAYTTLIRSASMTTDENGNAGTTLTPEAGRYQIRVTGYDADWRVTRAYREINVIGPVMKEAGLLLAADSDTHRIGETANLTIASAVSGPAWLTVERGTVRRSQLITLTAPLTRVALPIEAGDAPNIFVNVYAWTARNDSPGPQTYTSLRERTLRTASLNLIIEQPEKALTVTVTPNAGQYAPGDHATFTVRVTDARGEPVSAEVALALVSEAAVAWAEPLSGSFFGAFHPPHALTVEGFDSYAPQRNLFDWGGMCGGCGGDWYDGGLLSSLSHIATAGWAPSLRTDWNGEATVMFPLPNLHSAWRAIAIAATADSQVGEASVVVEVE